MRLSIVMEWANTRFRGAGRAVVLLERLLEQWQAIASGRYPDRVSPDGAQLLSRLDRRPELVITSGEAPGPDLDEELQRHLAETFHFAVHVAEGLEYYPLKTYGAERTTGDLLLFVDSDVLPEADWLAQLIASFARSDVDVVAGQTYVSPTDLVAKAFALGWTYDLRDDSGELCQVEKGYANNLMFRSEVFRKTGFPSVGKRSRGAATALREELDRLGIPFWENRMARVDHPPPLGLRHMVVRALAHGRDHYMIAGGEDRDMQGTRRALRIAVQRWARGFSRTFRDWHRVSPSRWEIPPVLTIITGYYCVFALGGILTYLAPDRMARHFRV